MFDCKYHMPILIDKINKNFGKECELCLKPKGLSKIHAFYLLCLYNHLEGIKLTELSNLVCCDKSNTSRAIADLANKKIIVKLSNRINDKKYIIKLTDTGYKICHEFIQNIKNRFHQIFKCLSEKEFNDFFRILEKISKGDLE